MTRNALTISNLNDIATNWDAYSKINHNFSDIIKGQLGTVTNQKSSGRCWGFAGLNLMRISVCKNKSALLSAQNRDSGHSPESRLGSAIQEPG